MHILVNGFVRAFRGVRGEGRGGAVGGGRGVASTMTSRSISIKVHVRLK